MRRQMTKAEARAFRRRWEIVDSIEREELRNTPIARKLQQLNALTAWGRYFGWSGQEADGVVEVRRRWKRLLQVYRG